VLSDVSDASLARRRALPDATRRSRPCADVSEIEQVEAVVAPRSSASGARRADQQRRRARAQRPHPQPHHRGLGARFRINVLGAVNGIRAAVPVMREQQSGSIILTASVAGMTAWSHAAPYCATKAAVISLAKVAAVEYARDGIG
jgi:3-oxoacyl-[acyl-carrier protein] reductase